MQSIRAISGVAITGLTLSLAAFGSARAGAQSDSTNTVQGTTLGPRVWGLEFEFEPQDFRGSATLAAKRHFTTQTALRAGVVLVYSENTGSGKNVTTSPTSSVVDRTPNTYNQSRSAEFFTHLVHYVLVRDHLGVFYEVGPFIEFSDDRADLDVMRADSSGYHLARDVQGWNWGVQGGLGFEWFFRGRLSLGARWGAAASYGNGWTENRSRDYSSGGILTSTSVGRTDSRNADVRTTPTVLILTAYL